MCPGRSAAHSGPRNARPEHKLRAALLSRDPFLRNGGEMGPGSAVHRQAALHRVRDTDRVFTTR